MKKKKRTVLLIGKWSDCPDIEYATGFRPTDPVIFLEHCSRKYLVISPLEFGRAKQSAPETTCFTPSDLKIAPKSRRKLSGWVIGLLKEVGAKSVFVPAAFPHAVARDLEKSGIKVSIITDAVYPERSRKKPDELKKLRAAQRAAVAAMKAAIAMISRSRIDKQGFLRLKGKRLTSAHIRREIGLTLAESNCVCYSTIVAGGRQAANPHEHGAGPLRAHEAIVMDIFPQSTDNLYWGDLTRTVVKGKPSKELQGMYDAVKEAQRRALALIRPGVKAKTIHSAVVSEFKKRGFETNWQSGQVCGFFHGTGHGVGLEIHERPGITTSDDRLLSGHVVTVEPGLYYPEIGGIRIEDTIEITASGWKYLATCEKKFQV